MRIAVYGAGGVGGYFGGRLARTSDHTDTISITIAWAGPAGNAMKPRFQCARTPWKPGFMASGTGPGLMVSLG
jgi:hypothetical protein